jgi:hypothetical protein
MDAPVGYTKIPEKSEKPFSARINLGWEWTQEDSFRHSEALDDDSHGRYLVAHLIKDYGMGEAKRWRRIIKTGVSWLFSSGHMKKEYGIGDSFPFDKLDWLWLHDYEKNNMRMSWKVAINCDRDTKIALIKQKELQFLLVPQSATELVNGESQLPTMKNKGTMIFSCSLATDRNANSAKTHLNEVCFAHWRKVIWSHDGKVCVVALADGSIQVVDPESEWTSERLSVYEHKGSHSPSFSPFSGISFLHTDNTHKYRILATGFDGTCFEWDITQREEHLDCSFVLESLPFAQSFCAISSFIYCEKTNMLILGGLSSFGRRSGLIECYAHCDIHWRTNRELLWKKSIDSCADHMCLPTIFSINQSETMISMITSDHKLYLMSIQNGELRQLVYDTKVLDPKTRHDSFDLYKTNNKEHYNAGQPSGASIDDRKLPIEVSWWSDEVLALLHSDSLLILLKTTDLTPLHGAISEKFRGETTLTKVCHERLFVLEMESLVVRGDSSTTTPVSFKDASYSQNDTTYKVQEIVSENSRAGRVSSLLHRFLNIPTFLWPPSSWNSNDLSAAELSTTFRHVYRLICMKKATAEEEMARRLRCSDFADALSIAVRFQIDTDLVYKHQFEHLGTCELDSVKFYFEKIRDKNWVLEKCIHCVPESLTHLLPIYEYILNWLESHRSIHLYEIYLNRLILYMIRLRTFLELFPKIRHDEDLIAKFHKFRDGNIILLAAEYALMGAVEALVVIFDRHWDQLFPFRLRLVELIPEAMDVHRYARLIPSISEDPLHPTECEFVWHPWIEHSRLTFLNDEQELASCFFHELNPNLLTANQLEQWFLTRAESIYRESGRLDLSYLLVRTACLEKGLIQLSLDTNRLKILNSGIETLISCIEGYTPPPNLFYFKPEELISSVLDDLETTSKAVDMLERWVLSYTTRHGLSFQPLFLKWLKSSLMKRFCYSLRLLISLRRSKTIWDVLLPIFDDVMIESIHAAEEATDFEAWEILQEFLTTFSSFISSHDILRDSEDFLMLQRGIELSSLLEELGIKKSPAMIAPMNRDRHALQAFLQTLISIDVGAEDGDWTRMVHHIRRILKIFNLDPQYLDSSLLIENLLKYDKIELLASFCRNQSPNLPKFPACIGTQLRPVVTNYVLIRLSKISDAKSLYTLQQDLTSINKCYEDIGETKSMLRFSEAVRFFYTSDCLEPNVFKVSLMRIFRAKEPSLLARNYILIKRQNESQAVSFYRMLCQFEQCEHDLTHKHDCFIWIANEFLNANDFDSAKAIFLEGQKDFLSIFEEDLALVKRLVQYECHENFESQLDVLGRFLVKAPGKGSSELLGLFKSLEFFRHSRPICKGLPPSYDFDAFFTSLSVSPSSFIEYLHSASELSDLFPNLSISREDSVLMIFYVLHVDIEYSTNTTPDIDAPMSHSPDEGSLFHPIPLALMLTSCQGVKEYLFGSTQKDLRVLAGAYLGYLHQSHPEKRRILVITPPLDIIRQYFYHSLQIDENETISFIKSRGRELRTQFLRRWISDAIPEYDDFTQKTRDDRLRTIKALIVDSNIREIVSNLGDTHELFQLPRQDMIFLCLEYILRTCKNTTLCNDVLLRLIHQMDDLSSTQVVDLCIISVDRLRFYVLSKASIICSFWSSAASHLRFELVSDYNELFVVFGKILSIVISFESLRELLPDMSILIDGFERQFKNSHIWTQIVRIIQDEIPEKLSDFLIWTMNALKLWVHVCLKQEVSLEETASSFAHSFLNNPEGHKQ